MSVLLVVGPKCTLAASHAAPWWVTDVSMRAGQTNGTPDHYITLFAVDAASVVTMFAFSTTVLSVYQVSFILFRERGRRNILLHLNKLEGCIIWNGTMQYSPEAVRYPYISCFLFTSCIRRCLVLRSCDWVMSALSATLFIFISIQSSFLPQVSHQAAPALRRTIAFDTQYRTSDVAENFGR